MLFPKKCLMVIVNLLLSTDVAVERARLFSPKRPGYVIEGT